MAGEDAKEMPEPWRPLKLPERRGARSYLASHRLRPYVENGVWIPCFARDADGLCVLLRTRPLLEEMLKMVLEDPYWLEAPLEPPWWERLHEATARR